jgi:hypothetical protein
LPCCRWYIITIVDLFLHETQIKATYGYILLDFFLACLKLASGIFLLAATHRIVASQLFDCPQVPKIGAKLWLMIGELFVITLSVMALYYLGSLLSNQVLWLGLADATTIDNIVSRRNSLQSAFYAMQLVLSLMILAVASALSWFRRMDISKTQERITIGATLAIWTRSFCELVVAKHYHPVPAGTAAARDAIYGLSTIAFLFLIQLKAIDLSISTAKDPILASMEEDTRRYMLAKVETVMQSGNRPPPVRSIMDGLLTNPQTAFSDTTNKSLSDLPSAEADKWNRLHEGYLNNLTHQYGHLGQLSHIDGDA